MNLTDTICAIATPPGEGGIGIIRISGGDSQRIARAIFKPVSSALIKGVDAGFESHRLYYGTIINPSDNSSIDDALMTVMKMPKSFTGEDVVEFHCHGSQLILQRVMELILKHGARLAEPGEFTKRAFLNSRMDLSQAEAIIDLIRAKTDLSLKAAHNQIKGGLSKRVNRIKEGIVDLLVRIEAELDFSEEDIKAVSDSEIKGRLEAMRGEIEKLLSTYEEGRVLKNGINCIILGRPNVGKSSLLNLLLKEERAIVTPIPGTTRDIIEEVINIKGIPLRLLDTAGLRETDDEVESIGIRLTIKKLEDSQVVLLVVDMTTGEFREDAKILEMVEDKKVIIVGNKMDIAGDRAVNLFHDMFDRAIRVTISALNSEGIEELRHIIYREAIGKKDEAAEDGYEAIVSNVRHKMNLERAKSAIIKGEDALVNGLSREFIAVELKETVERLGEITGVVTTDDILDRIFNQFCIGK